MSFPHMLSTSPLPYCFSYFVKRYLNILPSTSDHFLLFASPVQVMEAQTKRKRATPLTSKSYFKIHWTISHHWKIIQMVLWTITHTLWWKSHKMRLNLLRRINFQLLKEWTYRLLKVRTHVSNWKSARRDHPP